ncbi:MAG: fatty acid desaturase family protein [Pseudomonadota bacterium]
MPVSRAKPQEIFSAGQWDALRRVSPWRGLGLVAHAWAVIILALSVSYLFPNPLIWIGAMVVIGARQLGLAILMHEAAHGVLHPNQRVNDFVGEWFCAAPVGVTLANYRKYHLVHHKYTQTEADPDLGLAAPFPTTWRSMVRKAYRDLTGQTFLKQRFGLFASRIKHGGRPGGVMGDAPKIAPFLMMNVIVLVGVSALASPWLFLIWVGAMATWFQLALRIRNIAEHACAGSTDDPFTHARTTEASLLERALIAPYYVNFHCEHHLFMYVPCYNLPRVHALLLEKGYGAKMPIAGSYLDVLRRVTAPAAA